MISSLSHCYRLTYLGRGGERHVKTYCAKSHMDALARAARDGIADDVIGISRHDHCLRCLCSKLLRR